MRKILQLLIFTGLSSLSLLMPGKCFAVIEPNQGTLTGPFAVNATYSTQDKKFSDPNWSTYTTKSIQSTVALRVLDNVLISSSFTYTVSLQIQYYTSPTATVTTVNTNLTVNYAAGQGVTYKGLDTYSVPAAYKIIVKVTGTSGTGTPPASSVQLSTGIVIDRSYPFQPTNNINAVYTKVDAIKQLQTIWHVIPAADEYDLEWTTINDGNSNFATISTNAGSPSTPDNTVLSTALGQAFRNNASRITTSDTSFNISLITTDSILLVRIRQVQYDKTSGVRMTGSWDYKNSTGYAIWRLTWNEQNQNWQYSAAFAEGGKKKEVISYFDGTLRGRQTVTINNSDNVAIAQENIYDDFGRPSASILPAPYKETSLAAYLHYIPNFNLNASSTPYTSANVSGTTGVACELNPDPLNTSSGASRYYSNQNDFISLYPANNYIPDAAGYPLSVTQYTADNTGRIKSQGGVGLAFQPGKSGGPLLSRTTKYYYGKPEQWELDQLFGNDVGYAEHYLKNMVVDPNGQISISYLNASGKTVATALSGKRPPMLDSLPSYQPVLSTAKPQNIHILKPEQFIYNSTALTLTANTTYLASVIGSDTLKFNIQKLVDLYPGGTFQICSDCYYLATVKVTDDCGNTTASISTPIQIGNKPNLSDCNTGTYTSSLVVPVSQPGEYNVTIQYAFDNSVIQTYTDSLVSKGLKNGYIETQFNYIKKRYLDSLDVSGCYSDCHTCTALLGSQTSFVQALATKCTAMGLDSATVAGTAFSTWASGLFTSLKATCASLQGTCTYAPCDATQTIMQDDVSPGGQYALFDTTGVALEPEINILNTNWRTVFPKKPKADTAYIKNQIVKPDGTITSPNDSTFTIQNLITYWQPAWSLKFLSYHPEYCKLTYCIHNAQYEGWDMQLQQDINHATDTIPLLGGIGLKQVYKSTNAADWLLNSDPFFLPGGPGHGYAAQMDSDLIYYSSRALAISGSPIKGLIAFDDYKLYCQDTTGNINTTTSHSLAWSSCTPNTSCRVPDREWTTYRDNYFALKQKYYTILRNAVCGIAPCPVGQPITSNFLGSCPVAAEFNINAYSGSNTCGVGFQTVAITHNTGSLGQGVAVSLYYPSSVDTTSLTHSIWFNAGDAQKTFCVPSAIPVGSIGVKAVNCAAPGYGNDPTWVVKIITTKGGPYSQSCPGGGGYSTDTLIYTSLALFDSHGNPAYAVNPINVVLQFNYPICSGSSPPIYTMTIPFGQSTGGSYVTIQYLSSKVYCSGICPGYLSCVKSLTNVSNIQGVATCTGFTVSNPQPPAGPCPVAYTIKAPRFPDATSNIAATASAHTNPADSTLLTAPALAAMKAQAADMCTGNATAWISKLQPGLNAMHGGTGATPTEVSQLTAALISICSAGGDQTHPMGASSLPSGVSGPYTDFGAVIKGILLGGGNYTTLLNPWLIDAPYPYLVQQQSVTKTISTTSKTLCTLLTTLQTAAGGPSNLYSYLVTTYGSAMTLTPTDVSNLQSACLSCRFLLAQDVTLPVFLDPGATGWIPRATFAADTTALNGLFTGGLPHSDPNYPTILANYINQQHGFSLAYDDYNTFAHNSLAILCNTLPYTATNGDPYACVKSAVGAAVTNGLADYDTYIANIRQTFKASYINTCKLAQANANMIAVQQEYHYTLYYYDQGDNLVRTVPPEGVTLIDTSRFSFIDKARDNDTLAYAYNGPTVNSSLPTALTTLSATLTASSGAVEMWLYNNGANHYHWVEATPDNKYLFQVGLSGTILAVDVYPLTVSPTAGITFTAASGHYQANISSKLPLLPFTHVVFQGNTLGTFSSLPQIYVNGTALTVSNVTPAASPYGFTVTAGSSSVTYPDSIQNLKYLLLYNHTLTPATIAADAANTFFAASDGTYAGWYRFNVPNPGDLTTVDATTTNETAFYDNYPAHVLPTTYAYNATNQVNQQNSPDGGTNKFWYDLLSRLVISQNDKQGPAKHYSYTLYDSIGRITEVGQKYLLSSGLTTPDYLTNAAITTFNTSGVDSMITRTYYDKPLPTVAGNTNGIATLPGQSNLRKRVAASTYTEAQSGPALRATYYNYDLDGNVKTLWQQVDGLYVNSTNAGLKRIDYEYDLVSGKVNFVRYQDGQPDAFYYAYNYDAENRLTIAWSSTNAMVDTLTGSYLPGTTKKMDAAYYYYLHGPLRRTELGDATSKVQGMDYAYTLQGWLKGVNSTAATAAADMGNDGTNTQVATDAYGYNLYYYNTDYQPIVTTKLPFATTLQTNGSLRQLFNGNIAASSVNIPQLASAYWIDRLYTYDQLNRIKSATAYHTVSVSTAPVHNGDYDEQFTFDGNGNILTVLRNGSGTGTLQDNVVYNYNRDANSRLLNNRLNYLNGHAQASNITPDQALNNYTYDPIGNLTADVQAGITGITWNVYGKILTISKASGNITYTYNPAGERVSKTAAGLTTWYIRDAQGNTLAVYDNKSSNVNWREQQLYGSSRLGLWTPNVNLTTNNALAVWDTVGRKQYELTNHLGNVLATLTDKRLQHTTSGTTIDYYNPDIATAQDYYAYGSLMPARQYNFVANNYYRYGFNGKENDNEVRGIGNEQDYGNRIYVSWIGRFLSVDPITYRYPWYTPYQFTGNMPIRFVDIDGMEQGQPRFYFEPLKMTGTPSDYLKILPNAATGLVNGVISLLWTASDGIQGATTTLATGDLPFSFKDIKQSAVENKNHLVGRWHDLQNTKFSDFANYVLSPQGLTEETQIGFSLYTMSEPVLQNPSAAPAVIPLETEAAEAASIKADVQEAANQAEINLSKGKGPIHGTKIHNEFKNLITILRQQGLNVSAEVSYLNGKVVKYGTKGSVRADVVVGDIDAPTAIYDLKTGGAKMSAQEMRNYKANVPASVKTIGELKPQ